MYKKSIDLMEEFKKRYMDLTLRDVDSNGFFFNEEKKSWVFYDYKSCVDLLNNEIMTKNRMQIPLEIFNESQRDIVREAQYLLTKSLIFRDHGKSQIISTIHENYRKIDFSDLTSSFNGRMITDEHMRKFNDKLAILITGIDLSEEMSLHAANVGMLFDGRVEGRDHFVEIMSSFLSIYKEVREKIIVEDISAPYDINAIDLSIAFVAAHQTTMQLIAAALFDIKYFKLIPLTCSVNTILTEVSRLHPPVLSVGRVFNTDYNYRGYSFKKGDKALFMTGFANFDPNVFTFPFSFMPGRKTKPLSFGAGVHLCIGMGIAMSISSKVVQLITNENKDFNVTIYQIAEGVSALGAEKFTIQAE